MKKIILCTLYAVLLGMSSFIYSSDQTFTFPKPNLNDLKQKKLWSTFYHIWPAKEVKQGYHLLNKENQPISKLITAKDLCMGGIEGTIQVKSLDGNYNTFNYVDHKGNQQLDCASILNIRKSWINSIGKTRYQIAKGAYGDGVKNFKLIPYRTIAVDPKIIPYGTVIYIPQARGKIIKLPSGIEVHHDGYFYAADTGGAIKGNHIDVFSGIYLKNPFPNFIKSKNSNTFSAYIINDKEIEIVLRSEHLK
ncbi:hypothetical protein E0H88_14490 [Acinetobacter sp. ANC 4216]|uniref:3D domain-containing protein n=1 Tax=Acinetobacter sp. ANC 4216 TaxID=2529840 RepID=UPI00103BA0CF|nr:3D domain-containing protein [Acinetobacter sp. ANC 4216]TCB64860.1 hypothetical protein E0H88_14490 [Acinetobacter sp. ANC 4216]